MSEGESQLKPSSKSSNETVFNSRTNLILHTTTVYLLNPPPSATATKPFITAAIDGTLKLQLRHPLTLNHHNHHYTLPTNFDLSKLNPTTLAVSHHTSFSFDKLLVVPTTHSNQNNFNESTLIAIYDGGKLRGCLPHRDNWLKLWRFGNDGDLFDDIVVFKDKVYVVDREGMLCTINFVKSKRIRVGKTLVDSPVPSWARGFRWRKRLVVDEKYLYVVVRTEEKMFRVFQMGSQYDVRWFVHRKVLFMARDYYFFQEAAKFLEFENGIVFSEGAFPRYGDDCWEFGKQDIGFFKLCDLRFGREGENGEFPKLDWSPSPWVLDAWLSVAAESQSCSSSERELEEDEGFYSYCRDKMDGEEQSELKDLNNKDEKDEEMQSDLIGQDKEQGMEPNSCSQDHDDGKMLSDLIGQDKEQERLGPDSCSQDHDDGEMQCDLNSQENEDEGVTRTLLSVNGVNDATAQGTSMETTTQSIPRAGTPCTTKSHRSDSVTTKFEGFDVRSDFVPTLQKIWRKHGNIIENSTIRSGDIVAKALESLVIMVRILEDNSAQSLSGSQADYLTTTLSDLRCIYFKVHWLIPFVEKAVNIHKSKHSLDLLKNLSQSSSQVKERRTNLCNELAKLGEMENQLQEEMAKVFKVIPFSGQVKFDEPLGLGIT